MTVGGRFIPGCALIEGENKTRFNKCSDKFAESALQELIERKDAHVCLGTYSEFRCCPSSRHSLLWCSEPRVGQEGPSNSHPWVLLGGTPRSGAW